MKNLELVKLNCRRLFDAQKIRIGANNRMERLEREGLVPKLNARCLHCKFDADGKRETKCEHHEQLDRINKERRRLFRLIRGSEAEGLLIEAADHEAAAEETYASIVWEGVKDWPIVTEWLSKIRGIGPRLSGLLVANIGDIARFPRLSGLRKYAGLSVTNYANIACASIEMQRIASVRRYWTKVIVDDFHGEQREVEQVTELIDRADTITVTIDGEEHESRLFNLRGETVEVRFTDGTVATYPADKVEIIQGRADKRKKGDTESLRPKCNEELKVTLFKVADCFVKCGGPYRELYDSYKAYKTVKLLSEGHIIWTKDMKTNSWRVLQAPEGVSFATKPPAEKDWFPEYSAGRVDYMSKRRLKGIFLEHLWHVWRDLQGLPVHDLYAHSRLGHTAPRLNPWDFVDAAKAKKRASA